MPRMKVSHMDFAVAYVSTAAADGTLADVMKTTGMTKQNVLLRAKKLRDKGVNLPKLKVVRNDLNDFDIAQINNRINQITGKKVRL